MRRAPSVVKCIQGGTNYMPLRVNYSGVMPIIFAQSILMFPGPACEWLADVAFKNVPFLQDFFRGIAMQLGYGSGVYLTVYGLMILFFSYFWVATQFNELQIADDLKKNGGYIPGVRPGQGTSDYLHKAMSRITLAGAIFLTIIAVIPILMRNAMSIPYDVSQFFGGTSILITVGFAGHHATGRIAFDDAPLRRIFEEGPPARAVLKMIILKSERDLDSMRPACMVAGTVLEEIAAFIKPGVTTRQVDEFAAKRIKQHGAKSAFLGYRKYPCHTCLSVNDEVVHGLAGDRELHFGDIVSVDVGVFYKGLWGTRRVRWRSAAVAWRRSGSWM